MDDETRVRAAFADQAVWCRKLGSPFTALLMEALPAALDASSEIGRRVWNWPGPPDARGDAVPLRLAGGLHVLVRRGDAPTLAALYPPAALPDADTLAAALRDALAHNEPALLPWLDHPPQTNEVARSAILYAGLRVIAGETGLPLALHEIGASAGLNLQPDRYAYRLGGTEYGAPDAPLLLEPDWAGPNPGGNEPEILSRTGCDRNPLDIRNKAHRERLMSYLWPDQYQRRVHTAAALYTARADPPRIDRADAADWVEDVVGREPDSDRTRVLMHSIALQYLPPEGQARIVAAMEAAGRTATARTPLAWLAFEQAANNTGPALTLRLWPGGETRLLARADAHVRRVEWLG